MSCGIGHKALAFPGKGGDAQRLGHVLAAEADANGPIGKALIQARLHGYGKKSDVFLSRQLSVRHKVFASHQLVQLLAQLQPSAAALAGDVAPVLRQKIKLGIMPILLLHLEKRLELLGAFRRRLGYVALPALQQPPVLADGRTKSGVNLRINIFHTAGALYQNLLGGKPEIREHNAKNHHEDCHDYGHPCPLFPGHKHSSQNFIFSIIAVFRSTGKCASRSFLTPKGYFSGNTPMKDSAWTECSCWAVCTV